MKKVTERKLHLWLFEALEREPGIRHFVSDRNSDEQQGEFTLSFSSLPDRDAIQYNRNLLAEAMKVKPAALYFPSQVHKTRIVNVTNNTLTADLMETDALITNQKGICIAVMSADCVPVLLYDPVNAAVGAVHSGWRGTVAKILEKTLHEMNSQFGTKGEHIIAAIGPSVSQDSYEVGEEVVEEVTQAFGAQSGLLIPQPNNKAKLDLWKANKLQLLAFGVRESNIEVSDLCSVKNNHHFFSARKGDTGRYAAGIMLI